MSEKTITTAQTGVNQTVAQAIHWHESKSKSGEISPSSARLKITSLRTLSECLREDESHDATSVLAKLPELARRWQNLNTDRKAETARTYQARATTALQHYLAWVKDPTGFQFAKARRRPKRSPDESRGRGDSATTRVSDELAEHQAQRTSGQTPRSYPVGDEEFTFKLPASGLCVRDVMKIACHLMTLSSDFDPTAPAQAQFFAIARQE